MDGSRSLHKSRVAAWHEPMVGDVIRGLGIEAAKLRGAISAYEYVAPRLSLLERLFLDHAWELIAKDMRKSKVHSIAVSRGRPNWVFYLPAVIVLLAVVQHAHYHRSRFSHGLLQI